jgi:hypothetical protein
MTIEDDKFFVCLITGVLVGMFLVAIAPYLFRLFLTRHTDAVLPKTVKELIACYVYGTASVLLGGGLTVSLMGLGWVALVFLAVATGAGAVVVLRYFSSDFATNKSQNHIQRKSNSDLNND